MAFNFWHDARGSEEVEEYCVLATVWFHQLGTICKTVYLFMFARLCSCPQGYAGSEEVLGYCLKGRRQDAIVATKYGFRNGPSTPPYSAAEIDEAVTRALRKMETDYIDILQVKLKKNVLKVQDGRQG